MNMASIKHPIRWGRAFIIGILAAAAIVGAAIWLLHSKRSQTFLSLDDALWVSDWGVTTIYGPGTKEQREIIRQLHASGHRFGPFETPVLYRMGGSSPTRSSEGMVMAPFNPNRPRDALALKSESGIQ